MLFAVNAVDTPVTLKQGPGHQTRYKLVDSGQGYHHAKLEKSGSHYIQEISNVKNFFLVWSNKETC